MNNNTIESIKWHKDQLSKLLPEDNFYKLELELDEILEKVKTKKKVLVHRSGKTFYREQEVGSDDIKNPKLKELYSKLNDIGNKIKSYTTKIDNIDTADIEPDIKEKRLKRLNTDRNKLKVSLGNIKSEINNIEGKNKTIVDTGKSKVDQLEVWHIEHKKLTTKLDTLNSELKTITGSKETDMSIRAARLKEWKEKFNSVQKELKISKAKLKKIDK